MKVYNGQKRTNTCEKCKHLIPNYYADGTIVYFCKFKGGLVVGLREFGEETYMKSCERFELNLSYHEEV